TPAASPARRLAGALLALALAGGPVACKAPCDELRDFVCDGRGEDYCKQVDGFLAEHQVDAQGAPLSGPAREESCRYIMSNVEIQHAYRFKAREKLLGEPYWQVLKNMKPDERERWKKDHGIVDNAPIAKGAQADDLPADAPNDPQAQDAPKDE
ncbi:MAG: hypothetical protein KC420_18695, partial [Myxococcales bacterium]|nr:hypothetical protein [Myxococcales bacterium]